jgi:hypothetical protein
MTKEEIRKLAENEKALATRLINRAILKLPEGIGSSAARDIVNAIVNAAMLEMTALQKEAMEPRQNGQQSSRIRRRKGNDT